MYVRFVKLQLVLCVVQCDNDPDRQWIPYLYLEFCQVAMLPVCGLWLLHVLADFKR